MAIQKELKNTLIVGNPSRSVVDMLKRENTKDNKTKVILKTDSQGIKDYFLYHTISKF